MADDRPVTEHPYWWETAPGLRVLGQGASAPRSAVDVAVIGAGYTGLSAACRLARTGASVLVLEGQHVGAGASSRNGGQVLTGLKLDVATLIASYGEPAARAFFEASREAIARTRAVIDEYAIACDYERTGHLQAACKPAHFEAFRAEQALLARVFDHKVELVGRADQQTELGSSRYHGLLVDEESAGLNPARYVQGLAEAALRAGAQLWCGYSVERLTKHGKGFRVTVGGRDIDAGAVLVATNGYTSAVSPALQRRLVPIGSYIIATEPLSEAQAARVLPRRRMAFDSKHFLFYFRLTPDRRLLFGGRAEFARSTDRTTRHAAAILRCGMVSVFPELAETEVEYAWGGSVACTRDQMPHAGQLGGLYFAAGYCGHGIALATHLGDLVARRIAGEPVAHPLLDAPFPAIPLYRGRPWFLPLVGAYYRAKDWIE